MNLQSDDIVPIGRVRAEFTKLAEEVRATGREKLITRNGESYVALVDAKALDRYAHLEYLEFHRGILRDVITGLDDVKQGRTVDAVEGLQQLRQEFQARQAAHEQAEQSAGGTGGDKAASSHSTPPITGHPD